MSVILTDATGAELATPPLPIDPTEAEAIAAFHAFCLRHHLSVVYRCMRCYRANRSDGCNQSGERVLTPNRVRIVCRCGVREYVTPKGAGTLTTRLANTATLVGDITTSTIAFDDGERAERPAVILSADEAAIVRFYHRVMHELDLSPGLIHRPCWDGRVTEGAMMRVAVDERQVRLLCACRFWFYQGATFRV